MAIWKAEDGSLSDITLRVMAPLLHACAFAAILCAPAIVLAWLLPFPLFLPILSVVSFALAVIIALFAVCSKVNRRAPGITLWDVAGGFTLIWIVAGLVLKPKFLIEWFERVATML
jgi:hypothetical protein